MAGLTQRNNTYYARVSRYRTKQSHVWISLRTESVAEAKRRMREVDVVEQKIKDGSFKGPFTWEHEKIPGLQILTITEASKKYRNECDQRGIKASTIEIYKYALDGLIEVTTNKMSIEDIDPSMINKYCASVKASQKPITINKHLRAIKSFLLWANDNEYLTKVPRIRMLPVDRAKPKYISELDFEKIQKHIRKTRPELASVYQMYYDTGMRLSEAFVGELPPKQPKAEWYLHVPAGLGKNGGERYIEMKPWHWPVIQLIQESNMLPKSYSRYFWKTCIDLKMKGRKFHGLRHSYAVREWLVSGDLYKVARSLGHASITTTEIYASFDEIQLRLDFPTAWEVYAIRSGKHPTPKVKKKKQKVTKKTNYVAHYVAG
jgi:site-specific recombinase XerD